MELTVTSPEGLQEGEGNDNSGRTVADKSEVFMTGGFPPLVKDLDVVYRHLYS